MHKYIGTLLFSEIQPVYPCDGTVFRHVEDTGETIDCKELNLSVCVCVCVYRSGLEYIGIGMICTEQNVVNEWYYLYLVLYISSQSFQFLGPVRGPKTSEK